MVGFWSPFCIFLLLSCQPATYKIERKIGFFIGGRVKIWKKNWKEKDSNSTKMQSKVKMAHFVACKLTITFNEGLPYLFFIFSFVLSKVSFSFSTPLLLHKHIPISWCPHLLVGFLRFLAFFLPNDSKVTDITSLIQSILLQY